MVKSRQLLLASKSPQRKALLEALGLDFQVVLPTYEERDKPGLSPAEQVEGHSRGKAESVRERLPASAAERLVLAVDTMVVIDGRAVGKASGPAEAQALLKQLSGRVHRVYSGITLLAPGTAQAKQTSHAVTEVEFAAIPSTELELYLAGGEWRERAGAYAIQGRASAFVERINGDYTNVVGLPVPLLVRMLRRCGWWPPLGWRL